MAVGYATLYGDMAGGFDVLKDVPKTLVFKLCEYRNRRLRDPAAGHRPPAFGRIGAGPGGSRTACRPMTSWMPSSRYVEEDASVADMVAEGFEEAVVRKVIRLVDLNEYKRRQAAVGPASRLATLVRTAVIPSRPGSANRTGKESP